MRSRSQDSTHDNSAGPARGSSNLPAALDAYAPGVIRTQSDRERAAIAAFLHRHPEYEVLPREIVLQIGTTYLDEDDHAEREMLAGEGVPVGEAARFGFDDPEAEEAGSDYQ